MSLTKEQATQDAHAECERLREQYRMLAIDVVSVIEFHRTSIPALYVKTLPALNAVLKRSEMAEAARTAWSEAVKKLGV